MIGLSKTQTGRPHVSTAIFMPKKNNLPECPYIVRYGAACLRAEIALRHFSFMKGDTMSKKKEAKEANADAPQYKDERGREIKDVITIDLHNYLFSLSHGFESLAKLIEYDDKYSAIDCILRPLLVKYNNDIRKLTDCFDKQFNGSRNVKIDLIDPRGYFMDQELLGVRMVKQ
jgi:hypothetical protein